MPSSRTYTSIFRLMEVRLFLLSENAGSTPIARIADSAYFSEAKGIYTEYFNLTCSWFIWSTSIVINLINLNYNLFKMLNKIFLLIMPPFSAAATLAKNQAFINYLT